MLPSKGLVAAVLLLSGAQAWIPSLWFAARDVGTLKTPGPNTTPEPATTTTRFPLPFETTTSRVIAVSSSSETSSDESTIHASTTAQAITATSTDNSISSSFMTSVDVSTTDASTTAQAPQTTGAGDLVGVPNAATNAASSFTNLATAASSIAANPSPSAEEVKQFQQAAQQQSDELQNIKTQLEQVNRDDLSEKDSHRVEAALVGLAALLSWFSTQLTALAPAVATPALAPAVFAGLAPAFAAAAAGNLLGDALDELEDLGDEDDGDNDPTKTTESSAASTTASETTSTTSSVAACSAIPYELNLPTPDDDDDSSADKKRRSLEVTIQRYERGHIEKRARNPYFGNCKSVTPPKLPANPTAQQLSKAIESPSKQNQAWRDTILRWYDRKDCDGDDMAPGWDIVDNTVAKAKGAAADGIAQYWTVDHIWELKLFTDFFEIDLLPGPRSKGSKLTCDEFDTIFMTKYGTCGNPTKDSKLKTVMEQLVEKVPSSAPKSTQLEFVAMEKQLNIIKGAMFKLGELKEVGFTDSFSGSALKTLQVLAAVGNAVDIFNSEPVKKLFEVTNQRMYNSFRGIDQFVTDKRIPISGDAFSFAQMYQSFMDDRLTHDAGEAWEFVKTWLAKVETDIAAMDAGAEETTTLVALLNGFKGSKYSRESHYSFSANRDLAGAGGDVVGFKRSLLGRDEGDGDSCPISATTQEASSTTGDSTATTEQTSTNDVTTATTTEATNITPTGQSTVSSDQTITGESTTTKEMTAATITGKSTTTSEQTTVETTDTSSTQTIGTTTLVESTSFTETTKVTSAEESTVTSDQTTTPESTTTSPTPESTSTVEFTSPTSTATTFSTAITSKSTSGQLSSITTSSSTEASTLSTRTVPNVRTITTNGMICTLVDGSNHPVCQAISTPTPNPAGTNIHVNKGCILVNNSPRCASDAGSISSSYESSYNVASESDQPYSTALILSGFDSSNDNHLHSTATCQLQARWPANYGDVYFGEDGCLYDSQSNKIFDQCCSSPDSNNNGPATNPYCPPAPADTEQDHGNHDGSAICASISKDTCLSAARRYIDDVVYHQYTSAVWPDDTGADIANAIFPIAGPLVEDLFGINYGCTVIWTCDNDGAFTQGMTGKQIKDSMLNIYNLNGAKGCGSTYLENGCHITVNGCNNCRDAGHAQTLWSPIDVYHGTFDDANDGFPPKR